MVKFVYAFLLLCVCNFDKAQMKYGISACLCRSSLRGPLEKDNTGKEVETLDATTGFVVGATAGYQFTDMFGVRAELLYSVHGGKKRFESMNAYQRFIADNGQVLIAQGQKKQLLSVYNSYIMLPVSVHGLFFKHLELSVGFGPSFLVNSTGSGELSNVLSNSSGLDNNTLVQKLDHNYYKDKTTTRVGEEKKFLFQGEEITTQTDLSAYQNFTEKDGSYYNPIDLTFLAGISYYLNSSLFIGARLCYGLNDVSNTKYDISLQDLDANNNFKTRDDFDRNFDWQFMVGFQF